MVPTTLVALHVDAATQILIKDLDGSQPLLLLPLLLRMMVNFSYFFAYMVINNVLHIANFTMYISAEYLGTTEVETATAALNVANPSTGDEGENGNCACIFLRNISLEYFSLS